jgi:hypothetical protein
MFSQQIELRWPLRELSCRFYLEATGITGAAADPRHLALKPAALPAEPGEADQVMSCNQRHYHE